MADCLWEVNNPGSKCGPLTSVVIVVLCCCFMSTGNSCGHVGTVSQPNHTIPLKV